MRVIPLENEEGLTCRAIGCTAVAKVGPLPPVDLYGLPSPGATVWWRCRDHEHELVPLVEWGNRRGLDENPLTPPSTV